MGRNNSAIARNATAAPCGATTAHAATGSQENEDCAQRYPSHSAKIHVAVHYGVRPATSLSLTAEEPREKRSVARDLFFRGRFRSRTSPSVHSTAHTHRA